MRTRIIPYAFVAPAMLLLLTFGVLPIAVALLVSFTDMNLAGLGELVPHRVRRHRQLHRAVRRSATFWQALGNTAIFAILAFRP